MAVTQADLVGAWRKTMQMCKVHAGETVALLTRPGASAQNLAAARHALEEIGCQAFEIQPLIKDKPLRENRVAMQALQSSDFILDFIGLHLLRTYELDLILENGARMLYVIEPPEQLVRWLPSEDDKHRVQQAGARLRRARTLRATSDAGTDLTVSIGEYKVLEEYGYSDEPGHWDHWPAGFLATWPNERSANGVVVLDAGDIIFPFKDYVRSPIRLEIEGGYIRRITGGFDAELLRGFFEQYRDPEAFAVSHLGWGLSPRARWTQLAIMGKGTNGNDGRSFEGNFLFSTGPNTDGGGRRDTLCHLDIPMRNCSVFVDDDQVVDRGRVLDGR